MKVGDKPRFISYLFVFSGVFKDFHYKYLILVELA